MKLKLGLRNKNVKTLHNALWQANVGMPSRPTTKDKNTLKNRPINENKLSNFKRSKQPWQPT